MNKVLKLFETTQCVVFIIDTELSIYNERIYAIQSIHKNDGKINIRFGNKTQIESMENSYVKIGAQHSK